MQPAPRGHGPSQVGRPGRPLNPNAPVWLPEGAASGAPGHGRAPAAGLPRLGDSRLTPAEPPGLRPGPPPPGAASPPPCSSSSPVVAQPGSDAADDLLLLPQEPLRPRLSLDAAIEVAERSASTCAREGPTSAAALLADALPGDHLLDATEALVLLSSLVRFWAASAASLDRRPSVETLAKTVLELVGTGRLGLARAHHLANVLAAQGGWWAGLRETPGALELARSVAGYLWAEAGSPVRAGPPAGPYPAGPRRPPGPAPGAQRGPLLRFP